MPVGDHPTNGRHLLSYHRQTSLGTTMTEFLRDLRAAARALAARPALTLAAVLTLALGAGATTTIFSVVDAVALRPLAFREAGRLITLCEHYPGSTPAWCSVAPPNVEDIASRSRTIDAIGIGRSWPYHIVMPAGAEEITAGLASPGLFQALGVRAELGRLIEPADMIGRHSTVAVITHEMWQARFGGATDIVGRTVTLDSQTVTIVGVIEPGLQVPKFERLQLWRPLHINPGDERHREWRGFVAYARVAPGASLASAQREMAGLAADLKRDHYAAVPGWGMTAMSLQDLVVGGVRRTLLIFLGAGVFVLLIACANVANLLLARTTERSRELSLRAALGASRGRILRGALAESALLATAGSLLGITAAVWGTMLFKSLAPAGIPRIETVGVNTRVMVFAVLLAAATTIVFGLAPALRATRVNLASALREGGRGSSGQRGRLGSVLVAVELALAIMLVAGAGLLARSYAAYAAWQPGFAKERLLTFSLFASSAKYPRRDEIAALWDRLEGSMRAVPGVEAVGMASAGPGFGGHESWEVALEGVSGPNVAVRWYDVSPGFFTALGLPIIRGRDFGPTDVRGAPLTVLVNESLARRHWPGVDPLGRKITFGVGDDRAVFEVIGVVPDIPSMTPGEPVEPQMFWSNRQQPRPFTFVVARATGSPSGLVPALRDAVKGVDRDLDLRQPLTMTELVQRTLRRPQFNMILIAAFGVTALVLAAIGTHGLLTYHVAQRRREMGIRLALGASPRRIVGEILRRGLTLATAGIGAGLLGALFLGRALSGLTAGVSSRDPLTLGASAVVLAVVALMAALWPALRASRVDPATTLGAD
jgi:predicted permease